MASDKQKSRENGGIESTELDPCIGNDDCVKFSVMESGLNVPANTPLNSTAPLNNQPQNVNKTPGRLEKLEKSLREKTGLSRRLLITAIILLAILFILIIIILVLAICWPARPHSHQYPACRDPSCLDSSAQMLRMINESISPCEDIRKMACGKWLHSNPLPQSRALWNQQEEMTYRARERIRDLIGMLSHPTRVSSLSWKIKHFYDSCMELDNIETEKALPLRKIITQLGGWHVLRDFSMLSWNYKRVLELLHKEYGVSPFFKISVTVDFRNTSRNIIKISPSGLGLPDRSYYYRHPDSPIVSAYKRFLKDTVQLLGATSTDAHNFAEDMFHFEKRIAEITPSPDDLQDPTLTNNIVTLENVKHLALSIPLQEILRSMFPNAKIDDFTELLVVSKQYLSSVSMIISTTDKSALNNYVTWTLASAYIEYLSKEYVDVVNAFRHEMTGAREPYPRWEICITALQKYMGLAVSALYEKSVINPEESRRTIKNIFNEIKTTMIKSAADADMPETLKNHVYTKLQALKVQVGFPSFMIEDSYLETYYDKFFVQKLDYFQNIRYGISFARDAALRRYLNPSEEDRWLDSLLGTTAVYVPSANKIIVPFSVLQKPFFQPKYPLAALYGSVGVRLSEAIVSSASPWNVLWDSEGKLTLPKNDNSQFMKNDVYSELLVKNKKYRDRLIHSIAKSDSRQAILEANRTAFNILLTINSASVAYKTMVRLSVDLPHIHQPALEHYDNEALFYIAHAQRHCASFTPQQQDYDNIVNYHIGDDLLLRLTMRQLTTFTEAFDCSSSSRLYSKSSSCVQF